TSMLNRRKGRKVSVADFLPKWDSGKSIRSTGESRQTPLQKKNILKALNARFGGKVSCHERRGPLSTLEELTVVIDADTKRLAKQFDDAHCDITRGFTKLENAAGKSGFASGSGFGKGFVRSYTSDMNQSMKSVIPRPFRDARKQFEAAGKNSGQSFASGFSTEAEKGLSDASRRLSNQAGDTSSRSMRDSGQRGGKSFLGGMTTGLGGFAAVFAPVIGGAVAAAGMIGGAVITASKDFEHAMN